MGYIERNLMNGESIFYRSKLHWVVFFWPVFFFVVAIRLFSGGGSTAAVGVPFILFAIVTGIASFIDYKTSEFGITNKRLIIKVGFIRRNSVELLLNKVESIQVDQDLLGRTLGYGTITISGTGGTKEPFHKIASPLEFRKKAQEQIASL